MLQLNYETILDQISKAANLTINDIENKVQIKLNEFNGLVSKEGAAHMVANELKIKLFTSSTPKTLKLREIQPKMSSLNTFGKIVNIYGIKSYRTEKHEGRVASLFIGDDTKTMRLTIWDETLMDLIPKMKEGDTIEIKNAYSRDNNGFTELHLGSKSQLVLNPEGIIVNLKSPKELLSKKIKEVQPEEFVTLFGTVVQIFEPKYYFACPNCNRKVMEQDGGYICQQHGSVTPKETPIINLFIDDGTATLRTVCFRDQAEQLIGPIKDFETIKKHSLLKQLKITGRIVKNEMFNRLEMLTSTIEEPSPENLIQEFSIQ